MREVYADFCHRFANQVFIYPTRQISFAIAQLSLSSVRVTPDRSFSNGLFNCFVAHRQIAPREMSRFPACNFSTHLDLQYLGKSVALIMPTRAFAYVLNCFVIILQGAGSCCAVDVAPSCSVKAGL